MMMPRKEADEQGSKEAKGRKKNHEGCRKQAKTRRLRSFVAVRYANYALLRMTAIGFA